MSVSMVMNSDTISPVTISLWLKLCSPPPHPTPPSVQVLKGSHHLGRIDHMRVGDQVGADLERVEEVKKVSAALSPDQYSVSVSLKPKSLD